MFHNFSDNLPQNILRLAKNNANYKETNKFHLHPPRSLFLPLSPSFNVDLRANEDKADLPT